MAGAILSSIISIASKLAAPIRGSLTPNPFRCVEEDLKHLRRTLLRIEAVLADAEEREILDESVKLWLQELKSLAYDADDVLDEYNYELRRIQIEGETGSAAPSGKRKRDEVIASSSTLHSFPEGMADRIKEIRKLFDEIAEARHALHLREEDGERRFRTTGKPPPSSSLLDDSVVYGREKEKDKLIDLLLSDKKEFSAIPIVGMGGVGKTTLARLAYNDAVVSRRFTTKIWVSVPEDFDVLKITKTIIGSFTDSTGDETELENLQRTLKEALRGKRLLLVLDDVWNERPSLWEALRAPLIYALTSKIIVTTRNESVARMMQTVPPIRLDSLKQGDCWLVFRTYAFGTPMGIDNIPPNFKALGLNIARKCKGLPLAAKTLGCLLRFETDEERWKEVSESELWQLFDEERNEILPALRLSYHRMPSHLKQCFVYCSLFPKGYLFEKDYVVNLWIAQGYIRPNGRNPVEVTGNSYFDELVQRSFFQRSRLVSNKGSLLHAGDGVFVMHDLIHDLAKFISGNALVMIEGQNLSNLSEDVLHASLVPSNYGREIRFHSLEHHMRLRSFYIIGSQNLLQFGLHLKMQDDQFQNLKCLRAIDLSYSGLEELPDSVGDLKHLRYLGLRRTNIRFLPESVCNLYNLQILDLKQCDNLLELPRGIGNLTSLKHLMLPIMEDSHVCIPPGIGKLINLQTLPIFYAGHKYHCGIGELKDLANLRELRIVGLEKTTEETNPVLMKMENIQKVTLRWHSHSYEPCNYRGCSSSRDEFAGRQRRNFSKREEESAAKLTAASVLESLEPHTNLSEFVMQGYNGTRLPSWMGDPSFSRLVSLKLEFRTDKCAFLPSLGQLPSLRHLSIGGMESLRRVGSEFCGHASEITGGFPALETLDFAEMWEWEEWCGIKDGDFSRLRELTISDCSKLCRLPGLVSSPLTELELYDCKALTGIPALPSLVSLKLWGECNYSIWPSSLDLPSLQYLQLSNSQRLRILHLHQTLKALRVVKIENCSNLTAAEGLQYLSSLECLVISKCDQFHVSLDEKLASKILLCLLPSSSHTSSEH